MKKMKRINIIVLFVGLFSICSVFGQNNGETMDDMGRLSLAVYMPENAEGMTPSANKVLGNKLNQIATKNGIGGNAFTERFIITSKVNVLTQNLTPTAPPMHAYTLEVSFFIGDAVTGTKFSNSSKTIKGVGTTETRAYLQALRNIKTTDPAYQDFINDGKEKIIAYYNSQCDIILKEAQAFADQNMYDPALRKLFSIPNVSKACFEKAMDKVPGYYQKMIDRDCKMKLNEATAIWTASQDVEAATAAAKLLTSIEPQSTCFSEVSKLFKKIQARVYKLDAREWDYKLKELNQTSELIKAYRDIGVATGENQPQNVTYNYNALSRW